MYVEEKILNDMVRFLVEFVDVSRETLDIFAQEDGSFKLSDLQLILHAFTGYYSFTAYIDEKMPIPFPEVFSFYSVKM